MANSSSTQQHRCVFVGNIPYDATEEQLIQICEEVGPVVSFRLVIDRETGKPKGYGFCEYKDEETALSARRNLQGYEINGRQLRVDFAENDKGADRNREQGRGGPGMGASTDQQKQFGGPAISGDSALHQSIGPPLAMTAASVMAGALGGAQSSGLPNGIPHQPTLGNDPLTLHLAKMSRSQLTQVMSDMKVLATQNKDVARRLLLGYPQLPKALFQAQIMLGMVTPQMLLQPNIRQAQAPITKPSVQAGQPSQQQTTSSLPGLPPLAPLTSTSAPMQLPPLQPRMPPSNVPQVGALHQTMVVSHSGSVTVPSSRPQPLGGLPAGGRMEGGPSLRPVNPPLLHNPGHMGPGVSGQNQLSLSNAHVNVPTVAGTGFQTGSSRYLGASEINRETAVVGQINTNTNFLPSSSGRQDVLEQSGRPMKYLKVDDNRQSQFLANELASSAPSEAQLPNALVMGSAPPDHSLVAEPLPNPDIEGLQSQIPSDLLQQLLSLTPEQLSALTPEQQEQVLQLQKMLR